MRKDPELSSFGGIVFARFVSEGVTIPPIPIPIPIPIPPITPPIPSSIMSEGLADLISSIA